MLNKISIKILIFKFISLLQAELYHNEIIAKVGDQIISKNDVIERAEYTARPLYCRGNTKQDKRIIVNTLIGEKLFSKEVADLQIPNKIKNYLLGRKNQKMREVLFSYIVQDIPKKEAEFSHWYQLSSYEYNIKYLSISESGKIEKIKNQIESGLDLNSIYINHTDNSNDLPTKDGITLFNLDNNALRVSLYSKKWTVGDIVGPIKTDDNLLMFYEIISLKNIIDLNPNYRLLLQDDITKLIYKHINETYYKNYVKKVMSGLSFTLNKSEFKYFSKYVKSWYKNDDVMNLDTDQDNIEQFVSDEILLELNNIPFTVNKVLDWIKVHPLEFRNGYYESMPFEIQLKYAIADLIRDRELNKEAVRIGLNDHPLVLNEYEKWYDNYKAMKMRDDIIGNVELNSMNAPNELNIYFSSLTKKYSDQIWINIDAINQLNLSSIDMIALNKTGPYSVKTPIFPIITSKHQFNYGRILD